jgi:putative ABC transport system substrate-binding protein
MRRREFIASLSGVVAMWPLSEACSQEHGRSYRLGILAQAPRNAAHWTAFFDELHKNGFTEGENLSLIDGFNTPPDRAERIAKMIIAQRPDVVLTAGVLTKVVQQETKVIPILTVSDDLIAEQVVASLAHPGANITGISILATELDGKRQEILLEAVPLTRRLAILVDPSVTPQRQLEQLPKRLERVALSSRFIESSMLQTSFRRWTPRSTQGRRRLMFWLRHSSTDTAHGSSHRQRRSGCRPSINGQRWPRKAG